MKDLIGVIDLAEYLVAYSKALNHPDNIDLIKQSALMFSRIAVCEGSALLIAREILNEETPDFVKEIEWLTEQGIIFGPEKLFSESEMLGSQEYKKYREMEKIKDKELDELKVRRRIMDMWNLIDPNYQTSRIYKEFKKSEMAAYDEYHDIKKRRYSIALRQKENLNAIPIINTELPSDTEQPARKTDIIQLVLNHIPVPDSSTSWEQIIEYRSDPDSQSKFLALRYWMSEVGRSELTPVEVEEKLEYLIDLYQRHMKIHRMKTNVGTLETVITTSAEVLGDLASFKWGKAAQALFSLKRRQVALLEGELTSPGSEVAYIVKARETF